MDIESGEEEYDEEEEEEIEVLEVQNKSDAVDKNIFTPLLKDELSKNADEFNIKIFSETKNMHTYLMESITAFQKIFLGNNLTSFSDFLSYLEKRAIPNNCVCAGVIDTIPGWRCVQCSTYENSIYCNDCYKSSKKLHDDHTILFLYSSGGMCDCGDPDSLRKFCPNHTGPFKTSEEIQNFIENSFTKDEIKNLKIFFDEFFYKFSRYLFILDGYDLFYREYFRDIYPFSQQNENDYVRNDIILLKKQFCIVFQNFLNFLRLISKGNLGILQFLANYFIKNNLYINSKTEKENENFMTKHKCYTIEKDDIKILYTNGESHKCVCPFMRLFLANYRDDIKAKDNENEEFILSFPRNLPLKSTFCITVFFLYNQLLYNNNTSEVLTNRNQFFTEDTIELLATKTNLIEETYKVFYEYLKEVFSKYKDDEGRINRDKLIHLLQRAQLLENDTKYYSKSKIRELFTKKIDIVKKVIDSICLFHNQIEFKSIFPHPLFQENKEFSEEFINLETFLINTLEDINVYFNWNEIEYSKEIFKYLINKIINQEKEGVKQLKENEFSFHLCLYRAFGLLTNYFCFNYAIKNNCTLTDAVNFFKQFFNSEEELELFVDMLLKDYFKLFGFISGIKNNYFNYYGVMNGYTIKYIYEKDIIQLDFCTLKYILALSNKKIDLIEYLKLSNIEKTFKIFSDAFLKEQETEQEKEKDKEKDMKKEIERIVLKGIMMNIKQFHERENNNLFQYESDKNNNIMFWIFLFEMIIKFMKDDSSLYFCFIREYDEILSSQTKKELFDIIKGNKDAYGDLKNILIENIICIIISCGNFIDLKKMNKDIDKNLMYIFKENNKFEEILSELTENKMKGEKKIFYLKDKYLNNLDFNYYINPNEKSKAQRYIQNFKNDEIKSYNKHFINASKLTFDFNETIYKKILLNKENLILFQQMIEALNKSNDKLIEFDRRSLRNSLLPVILNFLSNFSLINTKEFIKFKIENREIIKDIKNMLLNDLEKNKDNELFEKDLDENVKKLITEMDYYNIIYEDIKHDLTKLNDYDYCTTYVHNIQKEIKEDNSNNEENNNLKLKKQKLKEKFKLKMKNNSQNFLNKALLNKDIEENLKVEIVQEKDKENVNQTICFYCRNNIEFNKWEKPYGKIGLLINDYFYSNTVKATLRNEIDRINKKYGNKNDINYENYISENKNDDINRRIVSCGHFFHYECINTINNNFSCPLCLKKQNIIIPPLNILKNNNEYELLNGEKLEILEKEEEQKDKKINENLNLNNYVLEFMDKAKLYKKNNDIDIIDKLFQEYKSHMNFLENIFYSEGSTFNKRQQIDNLQNIILSYRYKIKVCYSESDELIKFVKSNLSNLLNVSNENNIISNCQNMFYVNLLEKILFSLSILFDYEELRKTFIYLIYIFLPYFAFGNYLKHLSINKISLDEINIDSFRKYMKDNNDEMNKLFEIFLKKLMFYKLITDYNNKNNDIVKSFNELSIEKILSVLNIDNLYLLLSKGKDKINFLDIFEFIPKLFNLNDTLFKLFKNDLNDIFNLIINNAKINLKENKEISLTKELIINFSPLKFDTIHFDEKIFDWIERNLEKKCIICSKHSKYNYICLICGNKVCHTRECNQFGKHAELCNGNNLIFIDMEKMKICHTIKNRFMGYIYPLYVNENGIGPNGYEMENIYKLSKENLKTTIKNFVSYEFFFK